MSALVIPKTCSFVFNKNYIDEVLKGSAKIITNQIYKIIVGDLAEGLTFNKIDKKHTNIGLVTELAQSDLKVRRIFVRLFKVTEDHLTASEPLTYRLLTELQDAVKLSNKNETFFFGSFVYTAATQIVESLDKKFPGATDQESLWIN